MLNVCDVGRFCVYIFIVKYFCLGCFVQIGCFDHSAGFFVLRMFSLLKFYRRMFCSGWSSVVWNLLLDIDFKSLRTTQDSASISVRGK